MVQAVAIPVGPGGVPQPPSGVNVNQRSAAPQAPAPQPARPAPQQEQEQVLHQYQQLPPHFQAPAPQAPQEPPQDQARGADIAAILTALSGVQPAQEPAPTQQPAPQPAPAPASIDAVVSVAGDPMVQSLGQVLSSVEGLDLNRVLGKALEYGDVALIDAAYLSEKAGAQAEQLKAVANSIVQAQLQYEQRIEQSVFSKFGNEQNFDAAMAFFGKQAPKEMVQYVKGMIDAKNPALIEQASNLVLDFVKMQGAHMNPAGLVQAGAGAGSGIGAPLDKAGFKAELSKLNPRSPSYEQERSALYQRRAAGKASGMP